MPRPLTAAARAALSARTLAVAYLFEAQADEGAQRINSWQETISYDGSSWAAAPNEWTLPQGIPLPQALVPEPFTMTFDGAHENDTGQFIGLLLSRTWHQRPCRFFGLLLNTTDYSVIDKFYEWRGRIDTIVSSKEVGSPATITMTLESGVFRAQEANNQTVSHNDQKRRDAADTMFRDMAVKQDQQIPFGLSWSKVPGARAGGGGGGGGGNPGSAPSDVYDDFSRYL